MMGLSKDYFRERFNDFKMADWLRNENWQSTSSSAKLVTSSQGTGWILLSSMKTEVEKK